MPFGRASIFLREGENVQGEQQDILYRAAEVWKELTDYHYVFTYGYKGELHEIKLTFSLEDFPHLAGFHYLKDLALPRYSPRKTVDMILSGKITHETVRTSVPVPCSRKSGYRLKPLTRWCCTTACQRIPNNERRPPAYGENHRSVGIVFFIGA